MSAPFTIILLCVAGFVLLLIVIAVIFGLRYIQYRESLALAEKGITRPESDGKSALRWGIATIAIGVALCLGLYPLGANYNTIYPLGLGPWMLFGLVPLFFGLALVLIYLLTYKK